MSCRYFLLPFLLPFLSFGQLPRHLQPTMNEGVHYLIEDIDYAKAAAAFQQIVDSIPKNHLGNRPMGASEYAEAYLYLGVANYRSGKNYDLGTKQMLKAMEMELGWSNHYAVWNFDTLLAQNQPDSRLYLARGLAHLHRARYAGGGDSTRFYLQKALEDIDRAESLGLTDYRVNYYRASVLYQMWWLDFEHKRDELALEQVNIAIAKYPEDPRCYIMRGHLAGSSRLNHVGHGRTDFDKANEKQKNWSVWDISFQKREGW